MIFAAFYVVALITASVHLRLDSHPRTPERVVEIFLLHILTICYGASGVFAFAGHKFRSDEVARSIGWPSGNPFQEEVAYADLGIGVLGLLCPWKRGSFWTATGVGGGVFLLGAASIHVRELRKSGNLAVNNAGAILPDLLTPVTALALLAARDRLSQGQARGDSR